MPVGWSWGKHASHFSFDKNAKITINTLGNVLFLGRRNDISFLVGYKPVVLIEHQSTINSNMPLRFLHL
jgi:hypothetical protein